MTTALALAGIAASVLGAVIVARNEARQSRLALRGSAIDVTAKVKLAIQRDEDLSVVAAAFIAQNPAVSNLQFRGWLSSVKALERHPELTGVGEVVVVPASRLPAYVARVERDPPGPLGPGGRFAVLPAGRRPYYCFVRIEYTRATSPAPPAGSDFCAGDSIMLRTRDSGRSTADAVDTGVEKVLGVQSPIYRGGTTPSTVAARRKAFIGELGVGVVPRVILARALEGHRGLAVILRHANGIRGRDRDRAVVFSSGVAPRGAKRMTIDLHNGSTVEVRGAVASGNIFAHANSIGGLVAGSVLSLLLAALIFALGTGRARAMRLVREKTGQLSFLALHDALTELPNRALVIDRAEQMLARARRHSVSVAAMYLDVDGFKYINDTLGHAAGDELLRVVAARLSGVVRESDTVGRLGGDEFVVLVEGDTLAGGPELVADRLIEVLRQPVELGDGDGRPVRISASIGIAVGVRAHADDLLRDADRALYEAKALGKDRYVLFEDRMHTAAADRLALQGDLADALVDDQLHLLYQPIFDLQTRTVTGVEALLRWNHPTRGVVAPDIFIPIAEQTGMIVPIGSWVLNRACAQLADWHRRGYQLGMSVNVSAHQLEYDEFVAEVETALVTSGLPAQALTLEITESVLMHDAEAAARRLTALKKLGVRIAIDDFGTGYSSLAYLRQFPVDALKIDRSFISGISASTESAALMHTLIQLGKTLGLETLGEGIEEQGQLETLQREQCDSGQGFLFARPLEVAAIEEFIERTALPLPSDPV